MWHWVNSVPTFSGSVTITGTLTSGASVVAAAGGAFFWTGRAAITSPSDGRIALTNNAQTAGVGLDATSDNILLLRNRAHSAYATLDVLGLRASGVAGATGTFANVTVVNGIVTSGT